MLKYWIVLRNLAELLLIYSRSRLAVPTFIRCDVQSGWEHIYSSCHFLLFGSSSASYGHAWKCQQLTD